MDVEVVRAQRPEGGAGRDERLALYQQDEADSLEYWRMARAELFEGIDLMPEQESQIEEILEEAAVDRALGREYSVAFREAEMQGDVERAGELKEKLDDVQSRWSPDVRIAAMELVLTEDQLSKFQMNRRLRGDRIVAEQRKVREQKRTRRGQRRPPAR